MKDDELGLWKRIKAFEFDKPGAKLTFTKRLAKENAISEAFARQIVDEYRKFIFLCCVSKGQIAPSHLVDQAWHLHLTYTRSYWNDLCQKTIGRDLHHDPTEGGAAEDRKFEGLYRDTLELYERYFGEPAPVAIWRQQNEIPEGKGVEVDRCKGWVIPKQALGFQRAKSWLWIVAIGLATFTVGCTSDERTLSFGAAIVLGIGGLLYVFRKGKKERGHSGSGDGSVIGAGCSSGDSSDGDCNESSDCSDSGGDSGCSSGCGGGGCGGGGD